MNQIRQIMLCMSLVSLTCCTASESGDKLSPLDGASSMTDSALGDGSTQGLPDASEPTDTLSVSVDARVAEADARPTDTRPKNILLLIADDLGLDASACYQVGQNVAQTPNIQELCDRGVVFRNAWVNPICSATRATLLTGRYGFRTGVGRTAPPGLQEEEFTLPMALDANPALGYGHATVGKWHLNTARNGSPRHPNNMGWHHFSGLLSGVLPDYFQYTKVVDGVEHEVSNYATTETVDDAVSWLENQDGPWLLWVAFNAPHEPFHIPPAHLHSVDGIADDPRSARENPLPYYKAAIEAMDSEIGRLFAAIGPEEMARTHIIYVGDNGTPGRVIQAPYEQEKAKGSLYNGGVHVPLIIAGPAIHTPGRDVDALVNGTDLFATTLELAGVDPSTTIPANITHDSVSMLPYLMDPTTAPQRTWIMSELFSPQSMASDGKTIRDETYKLIKFSNGNQAFYDLSVDPYEATDLLLMGALTAEQQAGYDQLSDSLTGLLATGD
jgi:arylsulfatase B